LQDPRMKEYMIALYIPQRTVELTQFKHCVSNILAVLVHEKAKMLKDW